MLHQFKSGGRRDAYHIRPSADEVALMSRIIRLSTCVMRQIGDVCKLCKQPQRLKENGSVPDT